MLANLKVAGSSVLGSTVMRVHARMSVSWTLSDTSFGLDYGIIVADAPTATNIDVSTAFGDDWMLLDWVSPGTSENTTLVPATPVTILGGRVIDLRSKRKIEELSETLFFCTENGGSGTLTMSVIARTLLALP